VQTALVNLMTADAAPHGNQIVSAGADKTAPAGAPLRPATLVGLLPAEGWGRLSGSIETTPEGSGCSCLAPLQPTRHPVSSNRGTGCSSDRTRPIFRPCQSTLSYRRAYVDPSKQVGDKDHLKIFASVESAEAWLAENDPEGVAFEHDVIDASPGWVAR
jgi:hypothetical protein